MKNSSKLLGSGIGFIIATYSVYTIINAIDARRTVKGKIHRSKGHVWNNREAYLSTVAFGLWLAYLKRGRA